MSIQSETGTTIRLEPKLRSRLVARLYFFLEYVEISLCSPKGPGRLMRWFFKSPMLLARIGLGRVFGGIVLLLTTIGRKSGKPRVTALAYEYEPATNTYYVVAGWGDRSQWYRNLKVNPNVRVRVGSREFAAVAEPAPEATALAIFTAYEKRSPYAARIWQKLTGLPYEESAEGLCDLAVRCPVIALRRG